MARSRSTAIALAVALATEAALFAVLLRYTDLTTFGHAQLLAVTAVPVWLAAVVLFARLELAPRRAAVLVLGVSALLQLVALTAKPSSSDDAYRYVWDAKVQLSGVDPYRYPPSAPQLAHLRDGSLFGAPDHCAHSFAGGCTSINRPTVRTIYPPVAEAAFAGIRVASFGGRGGALPVQLAAVLGCLAIGWLLLRRSRPWLAAVWAWCPVVVVEYANNAHVDWLAALLVVLAVSARGIRAAGVLLGAAIAVKVYPALVLPALMRRSWVVATTALAFVVLVYVPHVIAAGSAVVGYLPGYLREEQYDSGNRLVLLGALFPHPADTVVGALVLGAVGLWAWRRGSLDSPARTAVVVVGVAFLVFTPRYGWYAGVLLALVALSGAIEWLPVVLAPTYAYVDHSDRDLMIYAAAALLTAVIAAGRHVDSLRSWLRSISASTAPSRSSPLLPRP
jgi:alpha-1,2-mannosyltransferase